MLPDGEAHLQQWMNQKNQVVEGRKTYQFYKYEAALNQCVNRRLAIDVGGHVGLFSFWMAKDFQRLIAFEPKPEHVECWHVNMQGFDNATLYEVALGNERRQVGLRTGPSSSGDTSVVLDETGVRMSKLDDYMLKDVDF